MKIVADSGSTKTQWCLIENGEPTKNIFTDGINPFYQTENDIYNSIKLQLVPELNKGDITEIFFYGAGCALPDKKEMVENAFGRVFPIADIEINNDLLAAARALFGNKPGITCILGTGSNSCLYDGKDIIENISPLGFLLGDEGSGAAIGRRFIADLLKHQYPKELSDKFYEKHDITPDEIMESVYKKPFPNRFLAQFTHFMCEHQHEIHIREIVFHSFLDFFQRNIHQYEYQKYTVACMGSVSLYFEDILKQAATISKIKIGKIIKGPMADLIKYHTA